MLVVMGEKALADEIHLKNGHIIEGNILEESGEAIRISIVINNQLTGMEMEIPKETVDSTQIDGKYSNLVRRELIEEERKKDLLEYRERSRPRYDVDKRITERIERTHARNEEIDRKQESKRRFEQILAQEKEIIDLKHENRKDLITHSKKNGIEANVKIIDEQ